MENDASMNKSRLTVPLVDCKMSPDDTTSIGEFSGYASVWDSIDLGGDTVKRGAFVKSLDAWKSKNMLPQLLFYHEMDSVIGDWLEMEEDDRGLRVKGRLWIKGDLAVPEAVKAYNILRGTSVRGLSIGYRVKDYDIQDQMDGSQIRHLKEIDLLEVSIAPWAMEPKAEVTSVKDKEGKLKTKREVERALRDVGLSQREAKAFIAGGFEAMARDVSKQNEADHRDDGLDSNELLASLQNLSTIIQGK